MMSRIKGFYIGFLFGGAISSVFALLYASKPGKKLRQDIRSKASGLYEEGKKIAVDTWNEGKS